MEILKAVLIGNSGHYEYIFDCTKKNFYVSAISKGHECEDITKLSNEFLNTYSGYKVYFDPIEMLDKEKPDIAIINTIFNKNGYYVLECLKRNISVFCEKPVASELEELEKIEELYSHNSNIVLMGMFGISYEKHFTTAEKCIESGIIGDIRLIETQKSYKLGIRNWYYHDKKTYPGTIPWVSIHGIDWMYGVCDTRFDTVYSKQSSLFNNDNGSLETTCTSTFFNKEKQIIGIATSDYYRPNGSKTHGDDRLRCVGTKGIIEVSNGIVTLNDGVERVLETKKEKYIFDEFLDAIEGKNTKRTLAKYSFDVTKAALVARNSAYKGLELEI